MKLILHDPSLNLRGTSISLYDYAFNLKKDGHECIIMHNSTSVHNAKSVINKFQEEFDVVGYNNFSEIDRYIEKNNVDIFYEIKSGHNDNNIIRNAKSCIHAVFPNQPTEAHGDVYAYVSEWLSSYCSDGKLPFVPHMVNLPEEDDDYRARLNIPSESIVFGRYGGYETFDIPFVYTAIEQILQNRKDIYFLFCNTHKFISHPRVIFTNSTASLQEKVKFINTCDAFLHARYRGETFGLSILEFMSKCKPIITFDKSQEENHYNLLDGQGIMYNTQEELFYILRDFTPHNVNYNQTNKYLPGPVMDKFYKIFF